MSATLERQAGTTLVVELTKKPDVYSSVLRIGERLYGGHVTERKRKEALLDFVAVLEHLVKDAIEEGDIASLDVRCYDVCQSPDAPFSDRRETIQKQLEPYLPGR